MTVTDTIARDAADQRLVQYLLGDLSDDGLREIEERLMIDDEYFRALHAAEDELIDAYILNGLTPTERARFENHFLCSPERREGVVFAAAFRKYLAAHSPAGSSPHPTTSGSWLQSMTAWLTARSNIPRFAASGLAVIVVLGLAALAFRVVQLQREVEQLRSLPTQARVQEMEEMLAFERERGERLSRELQREQIAGAQPAQQPTRPGGEEQVPQPPPQSQTRIVTLSLSSMNVRGAGRTEQVSIPPGTQDLHLLLKLPGTEYQKCQATLTSEGRELRRWESVTVRRVGSDSIVTLILPAGSLPAGNDYIVRLSVPGTTGELESIGSYPFRVNR
jgi:hypothetical protein